MPLNLFFDYMTWLDKLIQHLRFRKAVQYIPKGAYLLDIGAHQGEFFDYLNSPKAGQKQVSGVGLEPLLSSPLRKEYCNILPLKFPTDVNFSPSSFQVITMLAVLEHIHQADLPSVALACHKYLAPGGLLIITVPDKKVDYILKALKWLRLIDGMSCEQHHGYEASDTTKLFSMPNFRLLKHEKFQFGLNNLFLFECVKK